MIRDRFLPYVAFKAVLDTLRDGFLTAAVFLGAIVGVYNDVRAEEGRVETFFDLKAMNVDGEEVSMGKYAGNVLLVVNTASKCGFTGQYAGLEELYQKYKNRGFLVLAFPSNDFMGQEPGSNEEIKSFCSLQYGVTFPIFAKAAVSGAERQPVFRFLTEKSGYGGVLWNFEKFLIDRKGKVLERWRSITVPTSSSITRKIEGALAEQ